MAELLLAGESPDLKKLEELIGLINGQTLRAGEIVWRIRDFVHKRDIQRAWVDINTVIGETIRLAEISLSDREVPIETSLAADLPEVRIDRVQIGQVLFNLIRNGIEAMAEVKGQRRLVIGSQLVGREIRVAVSDQGCGLPDDIAGELFTPFFTTKPEGMGMGLSISRGIVETHGGRLWAERNDPAGTSFYFTLPLNNGD